MPGRNKNSSVDERLDQLGRALVRASAEHEAGADDGLSSPFLYTRLSQRIAAERARREAGEHWFPLLRVVWRAVPSMALVAFVAFSLFWLTSLATQQPQGFSDAALFGERDAGVEQVVFADNQTLSSDEVLATIMNTDEPEVAPK